MPAIRLVPRRVAWHLPDPRASRQTQPFQAAVSSGWVEGGTFHRPDRGPMASRDSAAFAEFAAARSAALFRAAYLMVGDHALAEDLLQEALTKT